MGTAAIAVRRPPGPRGRPFIGFFPEFRKDPPGFLLSLARQYGDAAYFRLGPQHMYLVNRPDWVQEILVTQASRFTKSRIIQRSKVLLGEGMLTAEGEHHLRQRRLAQPAFHRERLASYARTMVECADRTSHRWRDQQHFNVAEDMMRLTLAIVGYTLFSADVESDATDVGRAMSNILGMFDLMLLPYSQYLQHLPLPSTKRFEKAKAVLDSTIYRIIRERRKDTTDRGDLLSMLMLAKDEQGDGTSMTDEQVRDEALTLFLAGHETTANALTWTWYLLAQHPEVERRLHAELDEVLGGRLPTLEDLPNLRYTEMVLAESIRLYPPAWSIGRLAIANTRVGEFDIPAGSVCLLSPYVMHRTERFYPDPERFVPDRWRPELRDARPRFAYFPFGGGVRVCIGERFAWMEGTLVLATLCQRWRLRRATEDPVPYVAQITLRPKGGMPMIAEAR